MNIDFRNRTIFTKILSGFILLLLLAALMGGVLYYGLKDVTGVLRRITERNAPSHPVSHQGAEICPAGYLR
ncbi:MAG: hypothetical protein ABIL06_17620 [Pseudomonadota bacterium]